MITLVRQKIGLDVEPEGRSPTIVLPYDMLVIYSGDILATKLSQGIYNQLDLTLTTIALNKRKTKDL